MNLQTEIPYKFTLKNEKTGKTHRYQQKARTRGIATTLLIQRIQKKFKDIAGFVIVDCTSTLTI